MRSRRLLFLLVLLPSTLSARGREASVGLQSFPLPGGQAIRLERPACTKDGACRIVASLVENGHVLSSVDCSPPHVLAGAVQPDPEAPHPWLISPRRPGPGSPSYQTIHFQLFQAAPEVPAVLCELKTDAGGEAPPAHDFRAVGVVNGQMEPLLALSPQEGDQLVVDLRPGEHGKSELLVQEGQGDVTSRVAFYAWDAATHRLQEELPLYAVVLGYPGSDEVDWFNPSDAACRVPNVMTLSSSGLPVMGAEEAVVAPTPHRSEAEEWQQSVQHCPGAPNTHIIQLKP